MTELAQYIVTFCAGFVIGGLYARQILKGKSK